MKACTRALGVLVAMLCSASPLQADAVECQVSPNLPSAYDRFGWSVSVSGSLATTRRAVVGAPEWASKPGSVYVFQRSGSTWPQQAELNFGGPNTSYFGSSVCIDRGNGLFIVAGAPGSDSGTGAAYLYRYSGGSSWTQIGALAPAMGELSNGDRFGKSVSIDLENTVVVGAPLHHHGGLIDCGAAYVFYKDPNDPNDWGFKKELVASDRAKWDEFGTAVAISPVYPTANNEYIIVGAPKDDHSGHSDAGSAYIFERHYGGIDNWGERKKLIAADPTSDYFGYSVAIDGDYAVVGAPIKSDFDTGTGAVYVFYRNQGGTDQWGQLHKIYSLFPSNNANFGTSVAIQGTRIVVGAKYDLISCGAAYVIEFDMSGWDQVAQLVPSNGAYHDYFGYSVAVVDDLVLAGAPENGANGTEAGMAYVYDISDLTPSNDDCGGKASLPIGEVLDLPFATNAATFDGMGTCMSGPNVWYCYTPSFTGTATITLDAAYDAKLAVYDGCACGSGTQLGCAGGPAAQCTLSVTQGNLYQIEIGGNGTETGPGRLSITCGASALWEVDFNTGIPGDWTIMDYAGTNVLWQLNTTWVDDNWTGGDGTCAEVNANKAGNKRYDTALISPEFMVPPGAVLEYDTNYQDFQPGYDLADVDISFDGGSVWSNLSRWDDDHGMFKNLPGEHVQIELGAYTGATVRVRFRYYNPIASSNEYWQVDNVMVTGQGIVLAACCFDDSSCQYVTELECGGAGGTWQGVGTSCETVTCPLIAGACCVGGACVATTTQAACVALAGEWHEGEDCVLFECPVASVWYFDDAGVSGWGQTYEAPLWEWMDAGPLPECTMQDLDPENPYYAVTPAITYDYSGYHFYAKIWLANNYPESFEPVTVELHRGWGEGEGPLIASTTVYVTEQMNEVFPGWPHIFDLGTISDLVLNQESLVLKIIYTGWGGDTHICWNGESCPSALHALAPSEPPGIDTVVCEPQGGDNPSHPSTYWYDVTPGDAYGRCDFHVQVFDPNPENYLAWSITPEPWPAGNEPTWEFFVQQVGSEWWATWRDPNCVYPITTGTTRFTFENSNPPTWGDWRVTIGASVNPHVWVSDFSGAHFMQSDGDGYRVHVPLANIHAFNYTQDLVGVWKADSAWGDLDGDGDLDLVYSGESNDGLVTKVYTNQGGTLTYAYDRFGVQNESSGNLALGDCDGDGDLDLVVAGNSNAGASNRLYRNDGAGVLTWDQTQTLVGLNYASLAWGDYDLDGDLDLYVQGHDGTAARAILYRNGPLGTLTADTGQTLVGLYAGSADWGDWDGDGDLDLIVTGVDGTGRQTILYKNNPTGTLVNDGNHALPGVSLSDTAWGDLEGDGDLDLAFTGETSAAQRYACVYTNDGAGGFTMYGPNVRAIYRSSCALGDYDNDGDLDVAFCGYDGGGLYTVVGTNTGTELSQDYYLQSVREGSLNWVDVDADGNLDLFMTGADWGQKFARLYWNTGGLLNTYPRPASTMLAQQCGGLSLAWDGATDTETPGPGLYYCVRVGTTSGGNDVMSGTYSTPLMGNAGQGAAYWLDLPAHQYFWSVRAVDSGLAASPWTPEQVAWCLGDVNCDGVVNFRDINPFVLLLSNPTAYQAQYPTCPTANGDINCDGAVGFRDINAFVALIASGVCS